MSQNADGHLSVVGLGHLLSLKDVAQRAGTSQVTVKRWTKRGKNPLPVIRIGYRTLRVSEKQLAAWLQTQGQASA